MRKKQDGVFWILHVDTETEVSDYAGPAHLAPPPPNTTAMLFPTHAYLSQGRLLVAQADDEDAVRLADAALSPGHQYQFSRTHNRNRMKEEDTDLGISSFDVVERSLWQFDQLCVPHSVDGVADGLDGEDEGLSSEHRELAHHLPRVGHKQADGFLLVNHPLVDMKTPRQDKVDPRGNLVYGHLPLPLVLGHRLHSYKHKDSTSEGRWELATSNSVRSASSTEGGGSLACRMGTSFLKRRILDSRKTVGIDGRCREDEDVPTREEQLLTSKLDPPQGEEDEDGNEDYGDARTNHHPHHLRREEEKERTVENGQIQLTKANVLQPGQQAAFTVYGQINSYASLARRTPTMSHSYSDDSSRNSGSGGGECARHRPLLDGQRKYSDPGTGRLGLGKAFDGPQAGEPMCAPRGSGSAKAGSMGLEASLYFSSSASCSLLALALLFWNHILT
ncbi:hypothetical protein EYF80_027621 [Liparis tanakae]|uniref:Uncharacterized protein n=1 Tax=Liparis tanakae TaxID=230148 RepID=A0A4Z2H952_9TELE|nr:hypothetical protein EYF80_027621 [Liparis tanakae]